MADSRHSIIAREGQTLVLLSAVAVFVMQINFGLQAAPVWLLPVALAWLFRDPARSIPSSPMMVVSPADGKVAASGVETDRFLHRSAQHVEIVMNRLGVFSLRSVTEGKVQKIWQEKTGRDKCLAVWIQTDEGDDTVLVFRPGRWLGRLSYQLAQGERVGHGQRIAYILFGCRIDVYLATESRLLITPGQQLKAGSDALAEFVHS